MKNKTPISARRLKQKERKEQKEKEEHIEENTNAKKKVRSQKKSQKKKNVKKQKDVSHQIPQNSINDSLLNPHQPQFEIDKQLQTEYNSPVSQQKEIGSTFIQNEFDCEEQKKKKHQNKDQKIVNEFQKQDQLTFKVQKSSDQRNNKYSGSFQTISPIKKQAKFLNPEKEQKNKFLTSYLHNQNPFSCDSFADKTNDKSFLQSKKNSIQQSQVDKLIQKQNSKKYNNHAKLFTKLPRIITLQKFIEPIILQKHISKQHKQCEMGVIVQQIPSSESSLGKKENKLNFQAIVRQKINQPNVPIECTCYYVIKDWVQNYVFQDFEKANKLHPMSQIDIKSQQHLQCYLKITNVFDYTDIYYFKINITSKLMQWQSHDRFFIAIEISQYVSLLFIFPSCQGKKSIISFFNSLQVKLFKEKFGNSIIQQCDDLVLPFFCPDDFHRNLCFNFMNQLIVNEIQLKYASQ